MITIEAPYPAPVTSSVLPSPELGDQENLTSSVATKVATDGELYTYVKRSTRRRFLWDFTLTRPKALELRALFLIYGGDQVRVTDHNDDVWIGYFTNNPFEFNTDRKAGPGCGDVEGAYVTITLEFEGNASV